MSSLQTSTAGEKINGTSSPRQQVWQVTPVRPAAYLVPAAAGCIMLAASVLPWLKDPLDGRFSAWQLPVDIGWQIHSSIISYGLLCACGGLLALSMAFVQWRPAPGPCCAGRAHAVVGWFCAVPVLLFLLQYLFVDLHAMNVFAQHGREFLLIEHHLGYDVPNLLIPLQPFNVTIATLLGRAQLLIDQMSLGVLLPCASAGLCIGYQRISGMPAEVGPTAVKTRRKRIWLGALLLLVCGIVLGRAPAASICNYEAKLSLVAGDYSSALLWLDSALALNPALDQLSFYHEERGQALYFLHPDEQTDNSSAYLASVYRLQGNDMDAYKELLSGWRISSEAPWMVDEMSTTLEMQAEYIQKVNALPVQLTHGDVPALPWLEELLQVDTSNLYGLYLEGRMQCLVRNYPACADTMNNVLALSRNPLIQSTAYTYMGLSAEGQGHYVQARQLLLKAIALDPNYRNNIAREELSGLH